QIRKFFITLWLDPGTIECKSVGLYYSPFNIWAAFDWNIYINDDGFSVRLFVFINQSEQVSYWKWWSFRQGTLLFASNLPSDIGSRHRSVLRAAQLLWR